MKVKKYSEFITENSTDIKSELISFLEKNRNDITSKGLDFNNIKNETLDLINSLDKNFLENITLELSTSNLHDKEEFAEKFNHVIEQILEELKNTGELNESMRLFSMLWEKIKAITSDAIKWIKDRIYTISGLLTLGLGALLLIIQQWGGGLIIPTDFANVAVNSILILGGIIIKYGQDNDKYKNYSEE